MCVLLSLLLVLAGAGSSTKSSKCGAVFMVGQTFRYGKQGNDDIGSNKSKEEQFEAFQSHKDFLDAMEKKYRCRPKLFLKTNSTNFDKEVESFFGKYLSKAEFTKEPRTHMTNTKHFCQMYNNNDEEFEYYVMIRADLILKRKFLDVFDPYIAAVQYTHLTLAAYFFEESEGTFYARVADLIFSFPREDMKIYVKSGVKLFHNLIMDLRKQGYKGSFHSMIDTLHDSDSFKDWTPLYRIANRNATDTNHSVGWKFSNDDHCVRNPDGVVEKYLEA